MRTAIALMFCTLLCPLTVLAADAFSYNYAELDYQHQTATGSQTLKGPNLDFSWTVFDQLQIVGGYGRLAASSPDISSNAYTVGIRGDASFSDQTDFTTDILYLNHRNSVNGISSTDNGFRLALGFRHLLTTRVELDGSIGHNWLNQSSNDASLGLLFNATSRLAAGLSYGHNGVTGNTTSLRVRFYF